MRVATAETGCALATGGALTPGPSPSLDKLGMRGEGNALAQAIFTYSKSPGWLLTPTRGGAIQVAYLPGS